MKKWLCLFVAASIGCSASDPPKTTGTSGSSGSGPTGTSGAPGTGGSAGTGGSGGSGASGGAAGSGTSGSGGASGSGGTAGSAGMGGSGGSVDAGGAGGGSAGADASAGRGGGASDGSTGKDADPAVQQTCTAFADTFCNKLQSCSSFVTSVLFGDVATCKQRWFLSCVPNFGAPGTSVTTAKTMACEQSLAGLACPAFLLGDFGAACLPAAGTIAQGGACGDDAQCASTFCARSPNAICGTCQPTTQPGDPCVSGSCSASTLTVCPADTSTCVRPAAGQVGDTCAGQEQCDVGNMVGCNPATMRCVTLTAASGGRCGANTSLSSVAVCPAAGYCSSPLAISGMCIAAAADGQACSDTGAHCMQPARCVGGRCVLPDPSSCQ